jgi:hypothetical protein
MNDLDELEIQQLRFYRLANGLMAIAYIAFGSWVAASLYSML